MDDEGAVYTCSSNGHHGSQERIPDNWATIEITNTTEGDALHEHNYTLICSVQAIQGMNIAPQIQWYYGNGSQVETGGRIKVGTVKTTGTVTSLSLTFLPVQHNDGGMYSCRAQITVPCMTTQPPVKHGIVNMAVTTQAIFQLRMGPLTHCSSWEVSKAVDLEFSIKKDIEQALRKRCSCDFSSSAIYSGEFSCQTTATEVIYRALINGSSELRTAAELVVYIEDWLQSEGTLLYNKFRLRLAQNCSLCIESFSEWECEGDGSTRKSGTGVETHEVRDGRLLLGSSSCYRFQSCGDTGKDDDTEGSASIN